LAVEDREELVQTVEETALKVVRRQRRGHEAGWQGAAMTALPVKTVANAASIADAIRGAAVQRSNPLGEGTRR